MRLDTTRRTISREGPGGNRYTGSLGPEMHAVLLRYQQILDSCDVCGDPMRSLYLFEDGPGFETCGSKVCHDAMLRRSAQASGLATQGL